jgi:curved DNA-binding protein CbpA
MLRPGANHYEVLGLTRGGDLAALREHYRLLIRMTHPDFAGDGEKWPDDAAARVNRANDTLSSSVQRAVYDSQLDSAAVSRLASKNVPVRVPPKHQRAAGGSKRTLGAYLSGALAVAVVAALIALWPSEDDASLGATPTSMSSGRLLNFTESNEPLTGESGTGAYAAGRGNASAAVLLNGAASARKTADPPTTNEVSLPRRDPSSVEGLAASKVAMVAIPETPKWTEASADSLTPTVDLAVTQEVRESLAVAKVEGPLPSTDIRPYQPVLADLLHLLETGQVDRVQRWAARATQQDGVAERFASAYRQVIGDANVTGLGQVRFDLKPSQERPVIQGLVQLRMMDRNQQVTVRDFRLRVQFVSRANGPQMAAIDAE